MPMYRRAHVPGGTFFLTLVTENRAPLFRDEPTRQLLRAAVAECHRRRPFTLDAGILLLDHLHVMLTLPPGDADFSTRVAAIKAAFTRAYLAAGGAEQPRSAARVRKRRRGAWQRWFWEHTIRDELDRNRHLDFRPLQPREARPGRLPARVALFEFRAARPRPVLRPRLAMHLRRPVMAAAGFHPLARRRNRMRGRVGQRRLSDCWKCSNHCGGKSKPGG